MEIKREDFIFQPSIIIGEYICKENNKIKIIAIKDEDNKLIFECVYYDSDYGFININNKNLKYNQNYDDLYKAIDALNDFIKNEW